MTRFVTMTAEQAQILEDVGVQMMRVDDARAMKVLGLSLAYKFAKDIEPALPDNVLEFGAHIRGGTDGVSPDGGRKASSPGVTTAASSPPSDGEQPTAPIPLHSYSKRVPCV